MVKLGQRLGRPLHLFFQPLMPAAPLLDITLATGRGRPTQNERRSRMKEGRRRFLGGPSEGRTPGIRRRPAFFPRFDGKLRCEHFILAAPCDGAPCHRGRRRNIAQRGPARPSKLSRSPALAAFLARMASADRQSFPAAHLAAHVDDLRRNQAARDGQAALSASLQILRAADIEAWPCMGLGDRDRIAMHSPPNNGRALSCQPADAGSGDASPAMNVERRDEFDQAVPKPARPDVRRSASHYWPERRRPERT